MPLSHNPPVRPPNSGEAANPGTPALPVQLRRFLIAGALLVLCFSLPLYQVGRFALGSALYSYIVLIPFVSAYLAWIKRTRLEPAGRPVHPGWAAGLLVAGLGFLGWAGVLLFTPIPASREDLLALAMCSLVLLLAGSACGFLGRQTLRVLAFPIGFLIFLAPLPPGLESSLETFLQHGSALTAHGMLAVAGTPVFRDVTYFRLPGFSMELAPECSGIRSTIALFITSLVAGQLLLRSPWKRASLALAVVPIALLRNGFRVFTIGELCVHIGPEMIDSYIHRHGGPIFFALSLVPFSLLLLYLYKSDRKAGRTLVAANDDKAFLPTDATGRN